MGFLRPLCLFLLLLVLSIPLAVTSAQATSALDPPREAISDGQPTHDNVLLLPLNGQHPRERINGLLVPSKLWSRQQEVTCATNYTTCQGSQFCCPAGNACCSGGTCCGSGTYCTTVGGVQGCCKIGHICNQVTDECTVTGQQRCFNENFCCAAGDTCYLDANNNPRCSSSDLSGSSGISIIPTPTSQSQKPSGTAATPISASVETLCRLKPAGSRGLFSRRRHTPMHRAPKRRSWF